MNFRFVFGYRWTCMLQGQQGQRMHKKEDSYECGGLARVCKYIRFVFGTS
jgi:hypothetical protein